MSNLWRALALLWLGGVASPALAEESYDVESGMERFAPTAALDARGTTGPQSWSRVASTGALSTAPREESADADPPSISETTRQASRS